MQHPSKLSVDRYLVAFCVYLIVNLKFTRINDDDIFDGTVVGTSLDIFYTAHEQRSKE